MDAGLVRDGAAKLTEDSATCERDDDDDDSFLTAPLSFPTLANPKAAAFPFACDDCATLAADDDDNNTVGCRRPLLWLVRMPAIPCMADCHCAGAGARSTAGGATGSPNCRRRRCCC